MYKTMQSKFASKCKTCGNAVKRGQAIYCVNGVWQCCTGQAQKIVVDSVQSESGVYVPDKFILTEEQTDIVLHTVEIPTRHLLINAGAGSGKTFTLLQVVQACRASGKYPRIAMFYFGADNAAEGREKLARMGVSGVECATTHSVGAKALKARYPRIWKPNGSGAWSKEGKIISALLPVPDTATLKEKKAIWDYQAEVRKILALIKAHCMSATTENISALCAEHDVNYSEYFAGIVAQALQISNEDTATMSFDDMIYLPAHLGLAVPQYDLVLCDERQDFNACQDYIAVASLAPGGKMVCVGDPYQAIYGFRGAMLNSMEKALETMQSMGGCDVLTLSYTRRCSQAVVAYANRYMPNLKAFGSNPVGQAIEGYSWAAMLENIKAGDAVLCRVNAPLLPLAISLLKSGKKVTILGKEFADSIVKLVNELAQDSANHEDFINKTNEYYAKKQEEEKGKAWALSQLDDKIDCIYAMLALVEDYTNIAERINELFGDGVGGITLSTIHKAKGLEWETVYLIYPEKMPHSRATKDWELAQENNMAGVGCTRAKLNLYVVETPLDEQE